MLTKMARRVAACQPPLIEGSVLAASRVLHALTWREAWAAYKPRVPMAEIAQRAPELAIDYDFTCGVIEDRIAFLARHAGRPLPD